MVQRCTHSKKVAGDLRLRPHAPPGPSEGCLTRGILIERLPHKMGIPKGCLTCLMCVVRGVYIQHYALWQWLRPHVRCHGLLDGMHMQIGVQEKVASQEGSKERWPHIFCAHGQMPWGQHRNLRCVCVCVCACVCLSSLFLGVSSVSFAAAHWWVHHGGGACSDIHAVCFGWVCFRA